MEMHRGGEMVFAGEGKMAKYLAEHCASSVKVKVTQRGETPTHFFSTSIFFGGKIIIMGRCIIIITVRDWADKQKRRKS